VACAKAVPKNPTSIRLMAALRVALLNFMVFRIQVSKKVKNVKQQQAVFRDLSILI
jgi:hypothetical protein